ncbi:MAG: hypothetical protein P1V29_04945 [Gammaproteobacteria bacterium]|nr:hypothetical protein [Gammaproteobacteria bacterium]
MGKHLSQQALVSATPEGSRLLRSPVTRLAIMLVVLLTTWLLTHNAASDLRGGDEGSGVGGTGRLPGGIGGTGLRPFITLQTLEPTITETLTETLTETTEITVSQETRAATLAASAAHSSKPKSKDSPIETRIMAEATRSATLVQSSIEGFSLPRPYTSATLGGEANITTSLSIDEHIAATLKDNNSVLAQNALALALAPDNANEADSQTSEALDWNDLSRWLAQRQLAGQSLEAGADSEAEPDSAPSDAATVSMLQRPQLPPLQRARPIQRAALLPPRIRPLKL